MDVVEKFLERLKERYDELSSPYGYVPTGLNLYEDLIEILEEVLDE